MDEKNLEMSAEKKNVPKTDLARKKLRNIHESANLTLQRLEKIVGDYPRSELSPEEPVGFMDELIKSLSNLDDKMQSIFNLVRAI